MSEDPFLTLVADALADAGRDLELDADLLTIDVASDDPAIGSVLAVVRPIARAVTFYAVHPSLVPSTSFAAVSELVVRATADLLDASLELDLATGSVAYRMPVLLGALSLDVQELGELLIAAVAAVETTSARFRGAVDDVVVGVLDPHSAAAQVRRAPVEELQAEVAELESS